MKKNYLIASAALGALLIASPAYADDRGEHRSGIEFKSFGKILEHEREHKGEWRDKASHKATSTVAIHGTVSAVNGSIMTVTGKNAAVYTVQTAQAEFDNGSLSDIAVGDTVKVKGTVSGTMIIAQKISEREKKDHDRSEKFDSLRAGIVTAISPTGFTIARLGTGATTITTNASTTVKALGLDATSTIQVGSRVLALGVPAGNGSLAAQLVLIFSEGFGWAKHWFGR